MGREIEEPLEAQYEFLYSDENMDSEEYAWRPGDEIIIGFEEPAHTPEKEIVRRLIALSSKH